MEKDRGSKAGRDMEIMAAGMHFPGIFRTVGKLCFFRDRQGVNIAAKRLDRAFLFSPDNGGKAGFQIGRQNFNAGFLQKFRQSKAVDAVFYGLRPASTALIASAGFLSVAKVSLLFWQEPLPEPGILFTHLFNWKSIALFALVFLGLNVPRLKKLHPILFIAFGALVGILFRF